MEHLKVVFQILRANQFVIKPSKCLFGEREVEYLGHFISHEGVRVDEKKREALCDWPVPKTVAELRGFLGIGNYYRKFWQGYGEIAKPLTALTKKGQFQWNEEAQAAFEKLKESMSTTPILAIPNFQEEFVIETDASDFGIGTVLAQGGRPILPTLARG